MQITRLDDNSRAVEAPAKINLCLEVLGKRPDGYHEIYSVMQAISLYDRLTVHRIESDRPRLTVDGHPELAAEADNLVLAAWRLMKERFALPGAVDVRLEKGIPVGAGLGGGSSDCAAMILVLNDLFELGLSRKELALVGADLGSDVPFFFSTGQAVVTGRGERVEDISLPLSYRLVLIRPSIHISTAKAYAELRMALTVRPPACTLTSCQTVDELVGFLRRVGNDFERGLLRSLPDLAAIKERLFASRAAWASMSGSGPTMYGIFGEEHRTDIARDFSVDDWQVYDARPVVLFQR